MTGMQAERVASGPVLTVADARKTYPDGPAVLEGVSLAIEPGSFCVLLGASGSGKTTLLRSIIGLVPLDAGAIDVSGTRLTPKTLRSLRRQIGMVHQDFGLSARLTAAQNVMAGTAPGLPMWRLLLQAYPKPVQEKACALLARVGLEAGHVNRPASGSPADRSSASALPVR